MVLIGLSSACAASDDDAGSGDVTTTTAPTVTAGAAPSTASTVPGETTTTAALPPVDGTFAPGRTPIPGFTEVALRIVEGPDGEPIVICVLVAATPEQRARGLMGVTDLGGYDGMLFRFPTDSDSAFWMKDTLLPLSIAYLDVDGSVVDTADMDPCPAGTPRCPSYPSRDRYRNALEVAQGELDDLGLTRDSGATVTEAGACPALVPDG